MGKSYNFQCILIKVARLSLLCSKNSSDFFCYYVDTYGSFIYQGKKQGVTRLDFLLITEKMECRAFVAKNEYLFFVKKYVQKTFRFMTRYHHHHLIAKHT